MSTSDPPPDSPRESDGDASPSIRVSPRIRNGLGPSDPAAARFGLRHLLIWGACSSVFLALVARLVEREPSVNDIALVSAFALVEGAGWMGLLVLISRQWRGTRRAIEPGQWLLAVLGARSLFSVLILLGPGIARETDTVVAATACLFIVPTLSRRLPTRWKVLFSALALLYSVAMLTRLAGVYLAVPPTLTTGLLLTGSTRTLIAAALLTLCAVWDFRLGHSREWMHWLGIAIFIARAGLEVLLGL